MDRAAVTLSVAYLFLLLISYFYQPLLPMPLFLFLFLLPGYAVIRLLKISFDPLQLLAFSLFASILISTQSVYWLSWLLGYSTPTIWLAMLLWAIPLFFIKIEPICAERDIIAPLLLMLFSLIWVYVVMLTSLWVPSEHGIIVGGWNYGDLFQHLSIIQSLNNGNWPPIEPLYPPEPLRYHWFLDLHTAISSKLLNVFPAYLMRFENALLTGLLSLFAYLFAFHLTKKQSIALLTAFIMVFGGGLGWVKLFADFSSTPLPQLLQSHPYDNDAQFFQVPSIMGGYLLVQRPQMVGIPAVIAILLLVMQAYPSERRKLIFAGILLGLLPPFQYHAFLTSALLAFMYFIYYFTTNYSRNRFTGAASFLFLVIPSLLAIPFLLQASSRASSMFKFLPGWLAKQFIDTAQGETVKLFAWMPHFISYAPTLTAVLSFLFGKLMELSYALTAVTVLSVFYSANFGIPLLLAIVGIFLYKGSNRNFLLAWAFVTWLLPNLFSLSNTQWDMAKFFTYTWAPISLFAGVALASLPRISWPVSLPMILTLCCLSAVTVSIFHMTTGWLGLTYEDVAAGQWIASHTQQRSIFAAYTTHNTPIEAIAGRFRILGYPGWIYNYGLPVWERTADLQNIYCGPPETSAALLMKYNASYIYMGPNEHGNYNCDYRFQESELFEKVYDSGGRQIWRLK